MPTVTARVLRRDERGASMVEAAVVTPVVVAMLFGIIEFGMLFKDYLGTQAMVRAGVRIASSMPRNASYAQLAANEVQSKSTVMNATAIQELWVYKANDDDDFPDGRSDFVDCSTCVKFRWDSGTSAFVPTSDTWPAASQNACTAAAGGPPDRVGVFVKVRHNPITGIIRPINVTEASALKLEPFPALSGCRP